VTDRIDQMELEELRDKAKQLLDAAKRIRESNGMIMIEAALSRFQPTTLDKVRELLRAEGWEMAKHNEQIRGECINLSKNGYMSGQEWWSKP